MPPVATIKKPIKKLRGTSKAPTHVKKALTKSIKKKGIKRIKKPQRPVKKGIKLIKKAPKPVKKKEDDDMGGPVSEDDSGEDSFAGKNLTDSEDEAFAGRKSQATQSTAV